MIVMRKVRNHKRIRTTKSTYSGNSEHNITSDIKDMSAYLNMAQKCKKENQIEMALKHLNIAKKMIEYSIGKLKKNDMKYFKETF